MLVVLFNMCYIIKEIVKKSAFDIPEVPQEKIHLVWQTL
jgi:hypothetical protein